MEALERRPTEGGVRFTDGSDRAAEKSPERVCVAEWQRRASACRRREDVSGHRERSGMAKSDYFFGFRRKDHRHWKIGCEDDWTLRICPAGVLAGGQKSRRGLRLQHGDKSGPGDSAARIARAIYSQGSSLADRRSVELPLRRRALHDGECFHRRFEQALWASHITR